MYGSNPPYKMAIAHFTSLLIFAFIVSVVFAVLSKETRRDRLIYGLRVFLGFVGVALALAWLMYPFPR